MIFDNAAGAIVVFDADDQVQLFGVAKNALTWSDFIEGFRDKSLH
jgi:hypothetical protein